MTTEPNDKREEVTEAMIAAAEAAWSDYVSSLRIGKHHSLSSTRLMLTAALAEHHTLRPMEEAIRGETILLYWDGPDLGIPDIGEVDSDEDGQDVVFMGDDRYTFDCFIGFLPIPVARRRET